MSAETSAATPDPHPGRLEALGGAIKRACQDRVTLLPMHAGQLTCIVPAEHWGEVAKLLRDGEGLQFESCVDVCGMDYLDYGKSEWETTAATASGFSRGVEVMGEEIAATAAASVPGRRFAVVYNLLSVSMNQRLRVRVYCPDDEQPVVDSVCDVWAGANWFEREAFDLFGIMFREHPDLRRLLTDYGFIGHPFRKDFPLSGNVEVRYDPDKRRVIYQPVTIEARVLVPKVIRHDNRYDAQLTNVKPNG
jgi:NADH-quinone oxidoreductase subunit C